MKRNPTVIAALAAFFVSLAVAPALGPGARAGQSYQDPDPDYDRLDGTGRSGKRVDVIEWEGNLEIHVYPRGSLKGLSLKLDDRNQAKPVMVIGYRFESQPKERLIRRAILGIDLKEGFRAFTDPKEPDFDKIIVSNNGLSGSVQAYALEKSPEQLYPEGHPALAGAPKTEHGTASPPEKRKPASLNRGSDGNHGNPGDREGREDGNAPRFDGETGAIQPFFMKVQDRGMNRR